MTCNVYTEETIPTRISDYSVQYQAYIAYYQHRNVCHINTVAVRPRTLP